MHPLLQGIRAVVFDAVGTVIHPRPAAPVVYAEVGHRFGSRLTVSLITQRFKEAFREEEELDAKHGWRTSEQREYERWQRIVGRVLDDVTDPQACFRELFEHFSRPEAWQSQPDALETFEALCHRGYVLGLGSNYDRRLRSVAGGTVTLQRLHHLAISSEVGWRKPARGFFEALCEIVGHAADAILYVGDDLVNDYRGARDAGLRAALVAPRLPHGGAEVVRIEHLNDLVNEGNG